MKEKSRIIMYTKERKYYGLHKSKFVDIYYPEKRNQNTSKLVCLYHGGFFKQKYGLDLMEPLVEDLVSDGHTVANIEYPRVGDEFNCYEMLKSVCMSFTYLSLNVFNIQKRIVIGHSAGGYYALMLLMQNQLRLDVKNPTIFIPDIVLAQAPVSDLWRAHTEKLSDEGNAIEKFIQCKSPGIVDQGIYMIMSPMYYQIPDTSKLYIVHGSKDKDVPFDHSDYFKKIHRSTEIISGEFDHYDVINPKHPIWIEQKKCLYL
jgi:dipeptidyl aminopeptidase/acylaminoacyl peptidase